MTEVGINSMLLLEDDESREREREFYVTPAAPGCGHMAAGAAEVHLRAQHVALSTRRI